MKFLYIKNNNSGFKEYNFNTPLIIFILFCSVMLFGFLGFGISKIINNNKVETLSNAYRDAISNANLDIENIEEQINKHPSVSNLSKAIETKEEKISSKMDL